MVYEADDFLVLNKPAGLITHPKNADDKSPSVTQWVLEHYPELRGIGEYPDRPGMMHRLDKDTSGLLIVAKTQAAFEYFKKLFQERRIQKTYLALADGIVKEEKGVIDSPIGRIGMKRTTVAKHGKLRDKKESRTLYRVVKRYARATLLEVSPETGRTHQIRVHLKHIGHPVVGDPLYGRKDTNQRLGAENLFLHASRLEFVAPDGKALALEADLPAELKSFLSSLN